MPAVLSMIFTANRNRIPCCFKIATHFPKVSHQAIFSAPTAVLLQSFALSLTQSPIFARKPLCRCYNGARFNLSMLPRRLIRNTERFSSSLCVPRFLLTNNTLSSLSLSLHQMKRWDCCTVTRHWLLCEQYRMYGTSVNKLTCELRIATFNVLAPCYKRLPSSQKRESDFPSLYRPRQASIISMLGEQRDLDIIALQEFWFHEDIQSMYMNALGPGYHAHFMQRPKGRDDGVAIFVRNHIQVINTQRLRFDDSGMRVALLLHLRLRSTEARSLLSIDQTNKPITKDPAIVPHLPCPATDGFVDFILANTHFSFPHSDEEHQARLQQSRVLSAHVDDFAREQNVGTTVLTGDFNGNVNSRSCSHLLRFVSCEVSTTD